MFSMREAEAKRASAIQLMGERNVELQPIAQRVALLSSVGDVESAARLALEFDPATDAEEAVVAAKTGGEKKDLGSLKWISSITRNSPTSVLIISPRLAYAATIFNALPLFGERGSARLRVAGRVL